MTNQVVLVPRTKVFPVAMILDSKVLEAYKEAIKSYDECGSSLDIFQDKNRVLAGSNCFAPIILRDLLPRSSRLATMTDLGLATELNPNFLKGFYSDTGLILRTEGDSHEPNDFLAKDLAKQLKERGITLEHPKVIYFDALNLKKNKKSTYGLSYKLSESAELGRNIIDAPELMQDFRFKTINDSGIPLRDDSKSRQFYAKKDGLSGFCLYCDSDLVSYVGGLAVSYDVGRVVVIDAEGVVPNFSETK